MAKHLTSILATAIIDNKNKILCKTTDNRCCQIVGNAVRATDKIN